MCVVYKANLQSMQRVLHWTNTAKTKGSNGPASQRRQKANHKRHQISNLTHLQATSQITAREKQNQQMMSFVE
jgi:hypothetical protein